MKRTQQEHKSLGEVVPVLLEAVRRFWDQLVDWQRIALVVCLALLLIVIGVIGWSFAGTLKQP